MILQIDKSIFERNIPSAIDPESGLFDRIEPFLADADAKLSEELLGVELYEQLQFQLERMVVDGFPSYVRRLSPSRFREPSSIDMIAGSIQRYIVNKAMEIAIPQLDLILTSSGFGVVSSSQIAPASRERVENLRLSCHRSANRWRDTLLLQLLGNEFTQPYALQSVAFRTATSSLFWTDNDVRLSLHTTDETKTLEDLRPLIRKAEIWIEERISSKQLQSIIDNMRKSELTEAQLEAAQKLRYIVALLCNVESPAAAYAAADNFFHNIYEIMEDNPEDFPDYINSSIYKGRHAPIYENKAKDPVFALL